MVALESVVEFIHGRNSLNKEKTYMSSSSSYLLLFHTTHENIKSHEESDPMLVILLLNLVISPTSHTN